MNITVPEAVILDNLYLNVVVGRQLFDVIINQFGKSGWNAYAGKLRQHHIWAMYSTPEPTEDDEHCMPVCIQVDWRGISFAKTDLSGLDLTIPMMKGCDFNGSNLSGAMIGSVAGATFRSANLQNASFQGDISDCDFSEASLANTSFAGANYHPRRPPRSLPESMLKDCHRFPDHWEVDENICQDDEPRFTIGTKSVELRSFWGTLNTKP